MLGFELERERREPNNQRNQNAEDLPDDDKAGVRIFRDSGDGKAPASADTMRFSLSEVGSARLARGTPTVPAVRRSLQRGHGNPPGRLHKPALALERFAGKPRHQPIGDEGRREWTEVGRRHVADRMTAFGVDHELARARSSCAIIRSVYSSGLNSSASPATTR